MFLAPLTLSMGVPGAFSFVSRLQQTSCANLPLNLPVITDVPPVVIGPNHSVGFRWNYANSFGAVSKGAILTDRCLDGSCDSFRRAGHTVHEITAAAFSAETLRMRMIPSHGVCGHRQAYFPSQFGVALLVHRRRI